VAELLGFDTDSEGAIDPVLQSSRYCLDSRGFGTEVYRDALGWGSLDPEIGRHKPSQYPTFIFLAINRLVH
jgi:hypothetical protein